MCLCDETGSRTFNIGGKCQVVETEPSGMYYNPKYQTYFNCKPGCTRCEYDRCLECSSPNVLVVPSSGLSFCQKQSPYFSCNSKYYTYDAENRICYSKQMEDMCRQNEGLDNCSKCVINEEIPKSVSCIRCDDGFLLQNGRCTSQCEKEEQKLNGKCVSIPSQCTEVREKVIKRPYKYNSDFIHSDTF